jgi:hypothetical protein
MLKSKLTAYSVTELAWMLEPKEHYGKVHRQYHSAPKTTTGETVTWDYLNT